MNDRNKDPTFFDDEGGTLATNPNQVREEAPLLPFRAPSPRDSVPQIAAPQIVAPQIVPAPSSLSSQRASDPREATQALSPVSYPSIEVPPSAYAGVRSPQGWGQGSASAFVAREPVQKPPPVQSLSPLELRRATAQGVTAASDAAAFQRPAEVSPLPPPSKAAAKPKENRQRERVELIGFERFEIERARSSVHLKDAFKSNVLDEDEWITPADAPKLAGEQADRRTAHTALTHGRAQEIEALDAALGEALDDSSGNLPVALVDGELILSLDDLEVLRALRAYGGALVTPQEKKLTDALEGADQLLRLSQPPPSDALQIARARIDEAFRSMGRASIRDLEPMLDRSLLESRSFTRRWVMGARRVLAHLVVGSQSVPVYLSEAMAQELPLFKRFHARMVIEVRTQQDACETHPLALRPLALGRVVKDSRLRSR